MYRNHLKLLGASLAIMAPAAFATAALPEVTVTARQEFSSMHHEVELQSGERLQLSHLHKSASYRVCVDPFKGSVPLRLFVDGKQSLGDVASCETVTGRHINVEPAAELPGGDYLVARFQRIGE